MKRMNIYHFFQIFSYMQTCSNTHVKQYVVHCFDELEETKEKCCYQAGEACSCVTVGRHLKHAGQYITRVGGHVHVAKCAHCDIQKAKTFPKFFTGVFIFSDLKYNFCVNEIQKHMGIQLFCFCFFPRYYVYTCLDTNASRFIQALDSTAVSVIVYSDHNSQVLLSQIRNNNWRLILLNINIQHKKDKYMVWIHFTPHTYRM